MFKDTVNERFNYLPEWIKLFIKAEKKFSLDDLLEKFKITRLTIYGEYERIRQENYGYPMKKRYEINHEKCQSRHQQFLYSVLQLFWPAIIRTEKWFYDKENKERYRVDIYIKVNDLELAIELNGKQHLLRDDRNLRDQNKSKFLMENNIIVISWTNEWMETNWWDIPNLILKVIEQKISDNKIFLYDLIKSNNLAELYIVRDFIQKILID